MSPFGRTGNEGTERGGARSGWGFALCLRGLIAGAQAAAQIGAFGSMGAGGGHTEGAPSQGSPLGGTRVPHPECWGGILCSASPPVKYEALPSSRGSCPISAPSPKL